MAIHPAHKYKYFLSAWNSDHSSAAGLWQGLTDAGVEVFWAKKNLQRESTGLPWLTAMEIALSESKHLLLVASPNGIGTKFVQAEYQAFYAKFMKPPERRLIPLLTPNMVVEQMPLFLQQF